MFAQWEGPYTVKRRIGAVNYEIDLGHRLITLHINMLKLYNERSQFVGMVINMNVADESDETQIPITIERDEKPKTFNIGTHLTAEQQDKMRKLLMSFPTVFSSKTGRTDLVTHIIRLTDERPCSQPAYRVPDSLKEELESEIQKLLDEGHIVHSDSDFCAPLVTVRKKDGTLRICNNFKLLNSKTLNDEYPMSDPSDIFSRAANCKWISTIDLNRAFWQIKLDPKFQKYCGFKTHVGLFQWVSMPMGLRTSCRTLQRLLDRILRGIHQYAASLLDDITIFTNTSFEDHLKHVEEVLTRLRNAGLTANTSKCQWLVKKLKILGHVIEDAKIKPSEDKVAAIQNLSRPLTKSSVKGLLGLTGYYRRFQKNYAETVWCLTQLLRKNMPDKVVWEECHQRALETLKQNLVSEPILVAPIPRRDCILQCDATQNTTAGILSQLDDKDNEERVVAYASRKLLPRERNYSVIEKELLSICWSLEHWDQWIYGKRVQVYTDHRPLAWPQSIANHNSRMAGWVTVLQKYDITTTWKRGVLNSNVDGLSRVE